MIYYIYYLSIGIGIFGVVKMLSDYVWFNRKEKQPGNVYPAGVIQFLGGLTSVGTLVFGYSLNVAMDAAYLIFLIVPCALFCIHQTYVSYTRKKAFNIGQYGEGDMYFSMRRCRL